MQWDSNQKYGNSICTVQVKESVVISKYKDIVSLHLWNTAELT